MVQEKMKKNEQVVSKNQIDSYVKKNRNDLLKNLAKEYRVQLDDPQGGKKEYDPDNIQTNGKTVVLDKSISKFSAVAMFLKKKKKLLTLLKEKGIDYFEKLWKENLSPDSYKFCKKMYEQYNIITIADSEILDYFGRIMGTVYNGNDLGKFTIVRDWSSVEKWSGRIKHEGIHSKQGGTKNRIISLQDLFQKRSEISGLVPWSMDYATDNQLSDRETYINQYKEDPIKDIKPYEFKKYKEKNNRFDAIKEHMQTDIYELKEYIGELEKKMFDIENGKITLDFAQQNSFTKQEWIANIAYMIKQKKRDLDAMERLQKKHNDTDDWHQFITFGEQDGYIYQETPEKRQTNFQSEESFRKHVAIDMFITHYGDKINNYKKGVEIYMLHRDKIMNIADEYMRIKDKKLLNKKMKALFTEIG